MGIFKKNNFDKNSGTKNLNQNEPSERIPVDTALNYLLSTQKSDGGWGFSESDESNVFATAVITIIFKQFSQTPRLAASINKAIEYLIAKQSIDGGFRTNPLTAQEAALAYIALIDTAKDTAILDNARNYLISMQLTNDSWNRDPDSNISALRALCLENSRQTTEPRSDRYWRDCGMERYLNKQKETPETIKGSITGQVIDSITKAPLQGVLLNLESDPEIKTITDMSGKFDLSDIPLGDQMIVFALADYTSDAVSVSIDGGTSLDIGTVALLSNLAVEDKKRISVDTTAITGEMKESEIAAKAGARRKDFRKKVSIAMLRRGAYETSGPEITPVAKSPSESPQINKPSVASTGVITGKVFDSVTKQAIGEALVSVVGKLPVYTDGDGVFTVHDVFVPDTCKVTISKEGYSDQFYQGDLEPNETMDMLVYLVPSCAEPEEISGIEEIEERPMASPPVIQEQEAVNTNIDTGKDVASMAEEMSAIIISPDITIRLSETLAPSAVLAGEDKQVKVNIKLEAVRTTGNPVVLSAMTNAAGDRIIVAFDNVMADPSGKDTQFIVSVDNSTVFVSQASLNKSDGMKIELILESPIREGQGILLSYTAGDVKSLDGKELMAFKDQTVINRVRPPVYGQDGFGYSGLIAQNPLRNDIYMTGYNQWPSGFYKNVLAFISGVFDGENIWMIPANADSVVKINKDTGVMTGYNKWPPGFKKGNLAFEGGVFDGENIWMIPANADSVVKINKDTGVMTEYNKWPSEFKKGGHAFAGGVFDGQHIWMIPSYAESVVKIDKDTGVMTECKNWSPKFKKGGYAFAGGVFDGQHIWMIPANADSVIKIDKDTGMMTEYDNWPAEFKKGGHAFAGGVFDGQHIWMIPYYADRVVKIDKDIGTMNWLHQRPPEFSNVEYAFTGGVFDGENIWMIPLNADSIVKVNKNTGEEIKYNNWPSGFSKGVNAFTGGVFDGENIWMIPSSADKVIKISSFSSNSVSANVTANDTFYFYISQDESVEGTLIGQGNSWTSVYSLNAALVPGVTNYLHIKSADTLGPIAAFIGDFFLNDENFHFKNGTQRLLTGEDCWVVYDDAFGQTEGTITPICKNGIGKWSTRFGIDLSAQWIWTNGGKDLGTRYFSTPIYYSYLFADPVTNVRITNTIPDTNLAIHTNSFSKEPYELSSRGEKTTVEWRFEEISIGQVEDISFDVTLKDLVSGEDRPVTDKLELFYENIEKEQIHEELGPFQVHVFKIEFVSYITTDKSIYKSQEDVNIRGTIKSLSESDQSIDVKIVVENSQGILEEEIAVISDMTFKEGEEKDLKDLVFKPGANHSGDYAVRLFFYDHQKQIGETSANFAIEAVPEAAQVAPEIKEPDKSVEEIEKIIPEYSAEEEAFEAGSPSVEEYAVSESLGEIEPEIETGEVIVELIGTINAQPNPVYQGLAVSISYNVSNDADHDLKDLCVTIHIINPDTEEVKKTFEAPAKAHKGASVAGNFILSTAIFEPRVYTAVLQVAQTKDERPKVIASADFEVRLINVIVT